MKKYDLQGIELNVSQSAALAYIANPANLRHWTEAFASVSGHRAVMQTPAGQVEVDLDVLVSEIAGTVDWKMTFPDGSIAAAYSRVVAIDRSTSTYSFVLTPPPVPLEALEGALESQSQTLTKELKRLKEILEHEA